MIRTVDIFPQMGDDNGVVVDLEFGSSSWLAQIHILIRAASNGSSSLLTSSFFCWWVYLDDPNLWFVDLVREIGLWVLICVLISYLGVFRAAFVLGFLRVTWDSVEREEKVVEVRACMKVSRNYLFYVRLMYQGRTSRYHALLVLRCFILNIIIFHTSNMFDASTCIYIA